MYKSFVNRNLQLISVTYFFYYVFYYVFIFRRRKFVQPSVGFLGHLGEENGVSKRSAARAAIG
jgi:hypothetical protein